jgi:hypothetical protein
MYRVSKNQSQEKNSNFHAKNFSETACVSAFIIVARVRPHRFAWNLGERCARNVRGSYH